MRKPHLHLIHMTIHLPASFCTLWGGNIKGDDIPENVDKLTMVANNAMTSIAAGKAEAVPHKAIPQWTNERADVCPQY
jgi:hypothetical protein